MRLKIPCSVVQGICLQVIEFARRPGASIAVKNQILQNSLFISLLAGNLGQSLVRHGLCRPPRIHANRDFLKYRKMPAFGGLIFRPFGLWNEAFGFQGPFRYARLQPKNRVSWETETHVRETRFELFEPKEARGLPFLLSDCRDLKVIYSMNLCN